MNNSKHRKKLCMQAIGKLKKQVKEYDVIKQYIDSHFRGRTKSRNGKSGQSADKKTKKKTGRGS